jgi:hypothetical protein
MAAGERFCRQCGAPADGEIVQGSGLLPPFDAERFRDVATGSSEARTEAAGRTVPLWVLLVVIVLALALGAALGVFG